MIINLALTNKDLYQGCSIEEVAGRLNLTTPISDAVNIVGRNINGQILNIDPGIRDVVVLTGPMAVWSYLVVFHAVVHTFAEVRYNDGKQEVVVAKHGGAV